MDLHVYLSRSACLALIATTAVTLSCGQPNAKAPTKTVDAGTSADALPPVPPNPLPDARRIPEAQPR
jgi:hypothetical protein